MCRYLYGVFLNFGSCALKGTTVALLSLVREKESCMFHHCLHTNNFPSAMGYLSSRVSAWLFQALSMKDKQRGCHCHGNSNHKVCGWRSRPWLAVKDWVLQDSQHVAVGVTKFCSSEEPPSTAFLSWKCGENHSGEVLLCVDRWRQSGNF